MHYARRPSFDVANALMQQALNGTTDTIDWSIETSLYHLFMHNRHVSESNSNSHFHSDLYPSYPSTKFDRLSSVSSFTSSLSPSEAGDGWRFLSRFIIYFIKGCFVGTFTKM